MTTASKTWRLVVTTFVNGQLGSTEEIKFDNETAANDYAASAEAAGCIVAVWECERNRPKLRDLRGGRDYPVELVA